MNIQQRLDSIIQKDKTNNPKYIINILKSDFFYLINNYFEVDFDDIKVEINFENEKYNLIFSAVGDRLKAMKVLPE
ncbi:MAG: cell division topological specificity factor MinE [Candidatus Onthoplasma sp.]